MAEIKNVHIPIMGGVMTGSGIQFRKLDVIVTNDSTGKSISINDGNIQFTIPFEPVEKYFQ